MAVDKQIVTVEEFEQFVALPENADRRFELIDGEIVEMSPSEEHGMIAAAISAEIYLYLKQHPGGRVAVEPRHQMPDDEHNARLPDVAFTSDERALPIVQRGPVPQMPDLAVEVKSHHDSITRLREKAEYYLTNGSRMVWLVYPEKRLVEIYQTDADIQILTEDDTIDGGDVLPGFSMAVKDVFPA